MVVSGDPGHCSTPQTVVSMHIASCVRSSFDDIASSARSTGFRSVFSFRLAAGVLVGVVTLGVLAFLSLLGASGCLNFPLLLGDVPSLSHVVDRNCICSSVRDTSILSEPPKGVGRWVNLVLPLRLLGARDPFSVLREVVGTAPRVFVRPLPAVRLPSCSEDEPLPLLPTRQRTGGPGL